ncbi:MAG: hypothetical protein V4555_07980, partial [Acidobacteriota bacterium]
RLSLLGSIQFDFLAQLQLRDVYESAIRDADFDGQDIKEGFTRDTAEEKKIQCSSDNEGLIVVMTRKIAMRVTRTR